MSSELNLAELPVDVLLNIFGQTDQEKTKQKSIRTTLRLVCRRFNSIIIDPSNQRRLSAIRMKIEMISIAQIDSFWEIRVFLGATDAQTANREMFDYPPEIPPLKRRGDTLMRWGSEELTNCRKKISCEGNAEFFEIISQFEPRRLELDRIDLTRSLIFSLIDCLRGYPRIQCINLKVLDLGERAKVLNTSFAKDIDAGTMAKFASNFHSLIHIPKEFVNSEFMEKWTNGSDTGGFDFVKPVEEYEQHTRIPLRNFNRFWIFESTKLFTTLAEYLCC
ncbi:hypothetical protein PRIPAC_85979 [Pristionchus pacificus]|uniref:F-box domain-containing protein n=1 Tax=Pristionchus pacificus TaxID=54126 RepID=A0A2A6BKL7_PRIPA|nr:hypothetical protein PRIPAC_85979 [Pristionchus pacificus]|eukprot:PDM66455.1 hypothetical protein PRIPAC_47872 [Pristionchus pacificus]